MGHHKAVATYSGLYDLGQFPCISSGEYHVYEFFEELCIGSFTQRQHSPLEHGNWGRWLAMPQTHVSMLRCGFGKVKHIHEIMGWHFTLLPWLVTCLRNRSVKIKADSSPLASFLFSVISRKCLLQPALLSCLSLLRSWLDVVLPLFICTRTCFSWFLPHGGLVCLTEHEANGPSSWQSHWDPRAFIPQIPAQSGHGQLSLASKTEARQTLQAVLWDLTGFGFSHGRLVRC